VILNYFTKANLLLYSPYYTEACNEFAVPHTPSPRHSANATQLPA